MRQPGVLEVGPEDAVRLAPFEEGRGGVAVEEGHLVAYTATSRLAGRCLLPERNLGLLLEEYWVADLLPGTVWYIGAPFDHRVLLEVQWRQNGIDCGGELRVEGLKKGGQEIPFSWEIVISNNVTLFGQLPGYEVDVSFPVDRFHDRRDIVLRRRLAQQVLDFCVSNHEPGRFRVHKHDQREVRVSNLFRGRPAPRNWPVLSTLGVDIYEARRRGSRY